MLRHANVFSKKRHEKRLLKAFEAYLNAAFKALGMNKVYVPFRVPKDQFDFTMSVFKWLGVKGYSITIPHKEAVAKFLTKVDPAVKGIGAVNTVLFREEEVAQPNAA